MSGDNKTLARCILDGLPPAPRGVPKIEVTFDIDANGIVNVTARDQATGREQKVTITASSGLTDAEIQQMVNEAESHAAEDKARKDAVELRNLADSMAFQAEKTLEEHGDKVPSELKLDIENKISAVRDILENDPENIERLRPAYQDLTQTLSKVGEALYQDAGAAAGTGPNGFESDQQAETEDDEATVEGEFREVGD
jgi:molecular chaperone DnaK